MQIGSDPGLHTAPFAVSHTGQGQYGVVRDQHGQASRDHHGDAGCPIVMIDESPQQPMSQRPSDGAGDEGREEMCPDQSKSCMSNGISSFR